MEIPHFTACNIVSFGAVPDGSTLCTGAFEAAIAACAGAGGGTVYVPAGNFLTGAIHLRSNIALYLDSGARVIFSRQPEDYPLVRARWEGVERESYSPCLYGRGLENVAVFGRGELDGQGEVWWRRFREGDLLYPRPRLIGFTSCRNVLIEGIRLKDSPAWTINPVDCENVTIDKVSIANPPDSPNTDGINPESCRNVHISNCHVDVGDDCVTIKAGTQEQYPRIPCENITIANCTMVHGHGGVVIGSEMSGGVRNVVIANCVFQGTERGIRIKTRRGRGGLVEDLRVENVIMRDVMCPLVIHMYYHCGEGGKAEDVRSKMPAPVTDGTPRIRRIHLAHITAREARAAAAFIYGLPEMPISELTLQDVAISLAAEAEPGIPAMMDGLQPMRGRGVIARCLRDAVFANVRISGHQGPAFSFKDCAGMEMTACTESDDSQVDLPGIP